MPQHGFNTTAVIMHWLMAVSIFFLFVSSWWMLGLPFPSADFTYRVFPFQLHKSLGITVVFVLGIFLYARLKYRPIQIAISPEDQRNQTFARINHTILQLQQQSFSKQSIRHCLDLVGQ